MTEQQALQKMKKDIQLRGLSASTFKNYTRNVKKFFVFCNRPIEELGENDVRRFIEHLIIEAELMKIYVLNAIIIMGGNSHQFNDSHAKNMLLVLNLAYVT